MIIHDDCLHAMSEMASNSISCVVTDPPYGLSFMGKGWDHATPGKEYWEECKRIMVPGAFLVAMGGTRTFHRLACAIEDAGLEIRDCISWLYGAGFPKSHNHFGIEGYGTALKPAWEPCILAMKPCEGTFANNAGKWGQAGINIAATRVPVSDRESIPEPSSQRIVSFSSIESYRDGLACISSVLRAYNNCDKDRLHNVLTQYGNLLSVVECEKVLNLLYPNDVWCGLNWKAIPNFQVDCPAYSRLCDELIPIVLKNAPISAPLLGDALHDIYQLIFLHTNNHYWKYNDLLSIEDVSALLHALIDPLFNPTLYLHPQKKSIGRWPSNLLLCPESAKMLDEQSGVSKSNSNPRPKGKSVHCYGQYNEFKSDASHLTDSGGASRFFYCSKASTSERSAGLERMPAKPGERWPQSLDGGDRRYAAPRQNNHPTVKPLKLMEYLIKLVMPPNGGTLLDPFAGSGTTLVAAHRLGINYIGIEKEKEYCDIAQARINFEKINAEKNKNSQNFPS